MTAVTRLVPIASAQFWIIGLVGLAFLGLGLTGLIAPRITGALFGADPGGSFSFVQAVAARNTGISLLALTLLILDQRLALTALFVGAAMIAVLDFWIVSTATDFMHAVKHLGYSSAFTALATWLYFGGRS